jgi:hypothetical protein
VCDTCQQGRRALNKDALMSMQLESILAEMHCKMSNQNSRRLKEGSLHSATSTLLLLCAPTLRCCFCAVSVYCSKGPGSQPLLLLPACRLNPSAAPAAAVAAAVLFTIHSIAWSRTARCAAPAAAACVFDCCCVCCQQAFQYSNINTAAAAAAAVVF